MNTPFLFVVGATHRTAPLEFRERIALGAEAEAGLARELAAMGSLREFVILSTCNRIEIYGVAADQGTPGRVSAAFCALQRVDRADFGQFCLETVGQEAVMHLLEVACGLDSQILGETEILGQVKRAYSAAQARGSAGSVLNRLFQKGFQAAKHARTHTGISTGQVSVANLAVDLASNIFGKLENARVLLLGAGLMGEKSGRAFVSRGAGTLSVSSRRLEAAGELAAKLGCGVLPFEERESRLADWDVVVCSTAAAGTILSANAVRDAMKLRAARPILIVDLAMPRDVEGAAADAGNVFLYNLDDLARITETNRLARAAEAERARQILSRRAESLWRHIGAQLGGGNACPPQEHGAAQERELPAVGIARALS
jgi:glutamyl-tRNA reductase